MRQAEGSQGLISMVQPCVLLGGQVSPECHASHMGTDLLGNGPVLEHLHFSICLDASGGFMGNEDAVT